jgi:hypothetical protein
VTPHAMELLAMAPPAPACPTCGAENPLPIVYGFPDPEMFASSEQGDIRLGGCSIEEDSPRWQCRRCGHRWSDDGPLAVSGIAALYTGPPKALRDVDSAVRRGF